MSGGAATFAAALVRFDDGSKYIADADAIIRRNFGDEHPVRFDFLFTQGYVAGADGDHRASVEAFQHAIELAEHNNIRHESLPWAYSNACGELVLLDRPAEALPACEKAQALALSNARDSSQAVGTRTATATTLVRLHRYAEPVENLKDAISICDKKEAERKADCREAYSAFGEALLMDGRSREAVAVLEKALALTTQVEDSIETVTVKADSEDPLARALWATGVRSERIGRLAGEAVELYRRSRRPKLADQTVAWMVEHQLR